MERNIKFHVGTRIETITANSLEELSKMVKNLQGDNGKICCIAAVIGFFNTAVKGSVG